MKKVFIILSALILVSSLSCTTKSTKVKIIPKAKPWITFVELGSVNCIPCKQMQPVMKEIEEKYGEKIEVIFYDVWKSENKNMAAKYKIKLIPTQVFLDKNGKEFFRHEGFYPATEISKLIDEKLAQNKK
jgi:thioredoxin 1